MWWLWTRRLIWVLGLALKKIIESIFIVVASIYFVLVFDIYINTEKLSKVNPVQYIKAENIVRNPKFTKGPVIFRVDRGTLVFRLNPYFDRVSIFGYAPFFIFPHHRTIILSEETIKEEYLDVNVAHELGHIQGGLNHLGTIKEMEKYANSFAVGIVGVGRYNNFNKYLKELAEKEPQK